MSGDYTNGKPGVTSVNVGDGAHPGSEAGLDVLTDSNTDPTSTHYRPPSQPGDTPRPGSRNGDGVSQNRLGYRSTDQGDLPTTRDVTGGRIRRISE